MDNWPKEKLISQIQQLQNEIKFIQNKLKDLVIAYKNLLKEKEALESGFKALTDVCSTVKPETNQNENFNENNPSNAGKGEEQKFLAELNILMNSLTALSAEKSRMEATFQADKKLIRQEKEKYEALVQELQSKLQIVSFDFNKELEYLNSTIINERQEREQEKNDHEIMFRELQSLLTKEKEDKIYLEQMLSELASREELEKFKEIDIREKFLNLQKKHLAALQLEKQKVHKETEHAYEQRVAVLENRLAELSTTLVRYNQQKFEDQNEIKKLKSQVSELSSTTSISNHILIESGTQTNIRDILKDQNKADATIHLKVIKEKLLYYENLLLNANECCEKSLNDHPECYECTSSSFSELNFDPAEKIDAVRLQEYENEIENLNIKLRMLVDQNNALNDQLTVIIDKYQTQIEDMKEKQNLLCSKYDDDINSMHIVCKAQIMDLENQVQKQRDRTLALLDEKEQEVNALKSSFQLFISGNKNSVSMLNTIDKFSPCTSQLDGILIGTSNTTSQENPHILYYAHELARRDVVISSLRKNCCQLENSLRDVRKELIMLKHTNLEHVNNLNTQISRLERCQSREGANLEYLKNVIVNYLYSKNAGSKRHMLNAIAAVLKLTDTEMNKIKNAL